MAYRKRDTIDILNAFQELLDDLEQELFSDSTKNMKEETIFYGKTYSRKDWHDMRAALERVKKIYAGGVKKSYKYIQKRKQYNNLLRGLYYYKNKENKTEEDYLKIEALQRELEENKAKNAKEQEEKKLKKALEGVDKMLEKKEKESESIYDIEIK